MKPEMQWAMLPQHLAAYLNPGPGRQARAPRSGPYAGSFLRSEVRMPGGAGGGAGGSVGVNIATINVSGVMVKQAAWMDEVSTQELIADIQAAAADPGVDGIVYLFDTPGGSVAGMQPLEAAMLQAGAQKPSLAYVSDLCASAGYWAACAVAATGGKIVANCPTALVGCIGALAVIYDLSGLAGQMGIDPHVYSSVGELKATGVPLTKITAGQDQYVQQMIDHSGGHFAGAVKAARKMTDGQMGTVATGAVFNATQAQKLGLIDGIKGFEAALGDFAQRIATARGIGMARAQVAQTASITETIQNNNPGAGDDARSAVVAASSSFMEVSTMETTTQAPGATGAKPAALQELKQRLPKSTAEFREKCLEQGLTLEAAAVLYANEQAAELEQLKAAGTRIGNAAVTGTGKTAAEAGVNAASAKRQLLDATAQIIQASGGRVARHEAWKQALKANPEARRELVVAHNLKFGRKKQAAQFAEDFEAPPTDADD